MLMLPWQYVSNEFYFWFKDLWLTLCLTVASAAFWLWQGSEPT
ncbi:hypothetical protein IQ22_02834 [Pseudomonas duriflava]|uniref:Uncharacterized protein n=2 Tax=Pseudomonas duriflava TaxID=459528 RepID=A0A562Q8F7_9PSED|nr:hypothetical protein IQ22_02834 [Pseudomonas duriflava]